MKRLDGKIALITGAARGQGEAEVRRFAEECATVIACDVLAEEGQALADELGDSCQFLKLDVTREDDWTAAADHLRRTYGRLDVLVNNAGVVRPTPVQGEGMEDFDLQYQVNQRGLFMGMRVMSALMKDHGGSIVNIASASGVKPMVGHSGYVASKYAVRGMTKVAALELAQYGIRVNAVLPGFVATPMVAGMMSDDEMNARCATLPLGRPGTPRDLANLVLFLASDESAYSTGSDFIADGGLLMGSTGA